MRIEKLFKVLVMGGTVWTAGCGDVAATPPSVASAVAGDAGVTDATGARGDSPDVAVAARAGDASARADGVSSWMSWFVDPEPEDAGATADAGTEDAAPEADAGTDGGADEGVLAWLSWA